MLIKKIKNAFKVLGERRLSTVTGAWVFYFLISVIPIVFLLITLYGVFGVSVTGDLVGRLPIEFREAGETIIKTAKNASTGATALFVFTATYSCVRLLNQMSKDGDHLYGEKSVSKRGFLRKVWAFLSMCALFIVFMGASVLIAFGNKFFGVSFLVRGLKKLITSILIAISLIAFSFLIILLLNIFISPIKLRFTEVAFGGVVSLFTIVLGTLAFALYVRIFNSYNAFYGSLAGVVIFLFWVYIIMTGMVLGVIINAELYKKRKAKR